MKSEKGITLVTLVITLIVFIILMTTFTVNIDTFRNQTMRTNLENDVMALREEIEIYYASKKELPVINLYTNLSMIQSQKNVNDNDKYYIIDIRKLDVALKYDKDFNVALARPRTEEIEDLLDLYIINELTHTIYYPKGVEYNGVILYTLPEYFSNVQGKVTDEDKPIVNFSMQKSGDKLFGIEAQIEISDAFSRNWFW